MRAAPFLSMLALPLLFGCPKQGGGSGSDAHVAGVMSEKLSYYLSSTYVSSDNASNVTLLELIKKACPHIKKWWTAWRLDEAGPSSSHGMLFYRDGREGIRVVTPIETVMAPIQTVGFNDNVYLYKQIGGVFEPNAAHQLLVWFAM